MDSKDARDDARAGVRTLPVALGPSRRVRVRGRPACSAGRSPRSACRSRACPPSRAGAVARNGGWRRVVAAAAAAPLALATRELRALARDAEAVADASARAAARVRARRRRATRAAAAAAAGRATGGGARAPAALEAAPVMRVVDDLAPPCLAVALLALVAR